MLLGSNQLLVLLTLAVESATTELSSEVASSTTIRLGERFLLGSRIAVAASFFLKIMSVGTRSAAVGGVRGVEGGVV